MGWFSSNTPDDDYWMTDPSCDGAGCDTCADDGVVPKWLKDPEITGEDAARSWGWLG